MAPRASATALAALVAALAALPAASLKNRLRHLNKGAYRQRKRELLAAVGGDCRCLNWKDVFTQRGGRCGQGFERFLSRDANSTGAGLKASLFQELWEGELCDRVFARLDVDTCLQQHMGEGSLSAQDGWCYVGSTCNSSLLELHNLSNADSASMRARKCVPEADHFLYERSPQDLYNFSVDQGIDMGHLVKLAYPTMGESWEKVSANFLMGRGSNGSLSLLEGDYSFRLRRTLERGNTVVWSSRNGLPPFGVTQGTRAWEVGLLPRAKRAVLEDPNSLEVWASMTRFRCLSGCPGGDVPVLPAHEESGHARSAAAKQTPAGMLQLGHPWSRGRGLVQMRGNRKKRGEKREYVQVET